MLNAILTVDYAVDEHEVASERVDLLWSHPASPPALGYQLSARGLLAGSHLSTCIVQVHLAIGFFRALREASRSFPTHSNAWFRARACFTTALLNGSRDSEMPSSTLVVIS